MTPDQLVKRSGSSRRDYEAKVDGSTRLMQMKRQQAMADAASAAQKATDDALQACINAERAARVYADVQEGQARAAADTAEAAARVQGDDAERSARMTADGLLSGMIDAVGSALANEVTARTGANQSEASARTVAISSAVAAEAVIRSKADTDEATARAAADKTNADGIAKEITDRAAADATLSTKIEGRVKKISLGNVSAQFGAALLGLGVRTPLDVNVTGLRVDDGLIEVRPTAPMPAGYVMMQAYIKSAGVMTMIFYTPSLTVLSPMVTITFEVIVLRSGA